MKLVLRFCMAFALATAIGFGSTGGAGAQALRRVVRVTPNIGLFDGEKVHVVAKHWPPSEQVFVTECNANWPADGIAACRPPNGTYPTATIRLDGTSKIAFTVIVGAEGSDGGTCGTSSADNNCTVEMMPWAPGGQVDVTKAVGAPISFSVT